MDLNSMTDTEILKVANPIMDNLMHASTNNDFDSHTRDFSDRIKQKFTHEELQKYREEYRTKWGDFTERDFVGLTKNGNTINVYWKQKFSDTDDEFLAVLTLSKKNEQYLVERAFVDLWQLES